MTTIAMAMMTCGGAPGVMTLSGEAGALPGDKMYLYEIGGDYWQRLHVVDSVDIIGGCFEFTLKRSPELLFLGTRPDCGGRIFLDNSNITAIPTGTGDEFSWHVEGSPSDRLYREFLIMRDEVTRKRLTDSLDNLFYAARNQGDQKEMARIKEESMPYYDEGTRREHELVCETVVTNRDNPFGIWLYYSYIFRHKDFHTIESIAEEREYIAGFGSQALASPYPQKMKVTLETYTACAVGQTAPEISGIDTLGRRIHLSDYRGSYVMVDFWSSGCYWCRAETPALLRTKERFKDDNFVILGVLEFLTYAAQRVMIINGYVSTKMKY